MHGIHRSPSHLGRPRSVRSYAMPDGTTPDEQRLPPGLFKRRTLDTEDGRGGLHGGSLNDRPSLTGVPRVFTRPAVRTVAVGVAGQVGLPSSAALGTAPGSARIVPQAPNPSREISATTNPDGSRSHVLDGGGEATIYQPGSDTGDSGIFVEGRSVTHDKAGNLVPAAPSGVNPARKFAGDMEVIKATYPQVGVAGTSENKKFVDAYTAGGQNKEGILDLAHSLFGVPSQQAEANPLRSSKEVDPTQVAAARARGQENVIAANNVPSDARAAGATIPKAIGSTASSIGSTVQSGMAGVSDFLRGVTGTTDAEAKQLSDRYGFDSSNMGGEYLNAPPASPAPPRVQPTGTPVAPPTSTLATGTVPTVPDTTAPAAPTGMLGATLPAPKPAASTATSPAGQNVSMAPTEPQGDPDDEEEGAGRAVVKKSPFRPTRFAGAV